MPINAPFGGVIEVNNRGKRKLFAFSSLKECNKVELTSNETNCVKITSAV